MATSRFNSIARLRSKFSSGIGVPLRRLGPAGDAVSSARTAAGQAADQAKAQADRQPAPAVHHRGEAKRSRLALVPAAGSNVAAVDQQGAEDNSEGEAAARRRRKVDPGTSQTAGADEASLSDDSED